MRILVFHGYLLRGTGSNVYNANLAAALVRLGHEVHLLCQERSPLDLDWVDAAGDWDEGSLRVRPRREPVRGTVYRPDIGGLLPVYVADRYEGFDARPFPDLSAEELDRYLDSNVAAVRDVAERVRPDAALANHLVMGPAILARSLADDVPYAVKVHGSALEYTVKPHPRFLPHAREGVARARAVLVGSRHTAESLWTALEDPELPARTRLGPPGVDVARFTPREPDEAAAGVAALRRRLGARAGARRPATGGDAFWVDDGQAAEALARVDPASDRLVAFVGKLILAKGIDLLLAAWPLVLARAPDARLVVVGFGAYRAGAQRLVERLSAGDLRATRALALAGRAEEGGPRAPLRQLTAFLDALESSHARRARYLEDARALGAGVLFTGRLEHSDLADLLPACEALVVPSTFPEAFGMVAAEAAACGVLPVSAGHSGLVEVSRTLAAAVPAEVRPHLSFELGPRAVDDLADRICGWLQVDPDVRRTTRAVLVRTAGERYSWEGVARGVIAAAQGELAALAIPRP